MFTLVTYYIKQGKLECCNITKYLYSCAISTIFCLFIFLLHYVLVANIAPYTQIHVLV